MVTKDNRLSVGAPEPNEESQHDRGNTGKHQAKMPTTYFETLAHLLKATLGTGILAIPHAYRDAGWLVSVVGTVLIGTICTYAVHMLLQSESKLKNKRAIEEHLTYHRLAQLAIEEGPKKMRWLSSSVPYVTKIFFAIGQLGTGCIYVVFMSDQIKSIVDIYQDPADRLDVKWYMAMLAVPLILVSWTPNLKYLAPLSTFGTTAAMASFVIIVYYMFQDLPPLSTIEAVGSASGSITFFTTVMFALEAIGVILPLKNEMKDSSQFGSTFGVLNMAMIPNILMFLIFGFFGYLKFGSDVKTSISLSLPDEDTLAVTSRILLVVSIFVSHPLQMYSGFEIIWVEFLGPKFTKNTLLIEYIVRTFLVILSVVIAMIIPHLDLFISLIGALCLSVLGLAFPGVIHLFTNWYDKKATSSFWPITNYVIIAVGCINLVVGTVNAIKDIINKI